MDMRIGYCITVGSLVGRGSVAKSLKKAGPGECSCIQHGPLWDCQLGNGPTGLLLASRYTSELSHAFASV